MNKQGEHGIGKDQKCGYLNMHWYDNGDTCECGQIPRNIFFAPDCTCGASKTNSRRLVHAPDCAYIAWAEERNKWIDENQPDPLLGYIPIRVSKYYRDWNRG